MSQKLLETALGLSQTSQDLRERKTYADQAQQHGECALENVLRSGDECMTVQVDFLLAVVKAWKMYLQYKQEGLRVGDGITKADVQALLQVSLDKIKTYLQLDFCRYEAQVRTYLGYLDAAANIGAIR
jgi:hypothetical protein